LPEVSLEWVLIGYIRFIMRSPFQVQNWSHNKTGYTLSKPIRERLGASLTTSRAFFVSARDHN
jgi:hypothetical protein